MAINLKKGEKISLLKESVGLEEMIIGLGWDQKSKKSGGFLSIFSLDNTTIDCDASAILLTNNKLDRNNDVIYYGNLRHASESVTHTGDNLTGEGDGDDEQIMVKLKKIPEKYNEVVFVVNIYQAKEKKQNFGMIENAFIRVVDKKTNKEVCKYNLTGDYSDSTSLIFGSIHKENNEWKFISRGEGTKDGSLGELLKRYDK